VMMGLALPFGYMQTRMGGVSLRVFSGIMIGVGFHLLNGLFSNQLVLRETAGPPRGPCRECCGHGGQ